MEVDGGAWAGVKGLSVDPYLAKSSPSERTGIISQPPSVRGTLKNVSVYDLKFLPRRVASTVMLALFCASPTLPAQGPVSGGDLPAAPVPTPEAIGAYNRQLPAGVTVAMPSAAAQPLSLEDAIARGVRQNLQVALSRQNERRVNGLRSTVENALLPSLQAQAQSSTLELNLAAMGFKPAALGPLLQQFGLTAGTFQTIVKVNVTSAQLSLNQQIFNVPAYYLYKASKSASSAAEFSTYEARESIALSAGAQYLKVLADTAQINNARAQVESDEVAFRQARDRQQAGVGVHLDTLRAEVQLKNEQQTLISAENTFAKDKIQLNRLMGQAADQELVLTDTVPYAELTAMPHDEMLTLAYRQRKDLEGLEAQMDVAVKTERAARYDRLPTVAMNGYYGVLGETTGLYHGVFTATGSLNIPIFKEAQFRGEHEVAQAQILGLRQQIASLKISIDQQIRSSLLDVASANDLVKVSESNVQLSRQELSDSEERFRAGVDDNLPLVRAQGTLADAENRLVQTLYQYNLSKLMLARNVGVVETEYKSYLGR